MLAILLASKILKNSSSKWVDALESTQKVGVPFLLCIMHLKTIDESENGGMYKSKLSCSFIGLADQGKDIVFRFITEHSSLRDFGFRVCVET
jgi:hypothetical protein